MKKRNRKLKATERRYSVGKVNVYYCVLDSHNPGEFCPFGADARGRDMVPGVVSRWNRGRISEEEIRTFAWLKK